MTPSALRRRSWAFASAFGAFAAPGARVVIAVQQSPEFLSALFGCWYAGCLAVPAAQPSTRAQADRLGAIIKDTAPAIVLVGSERHRTTVLARPEWASRAPDAQVMTIGQIESGGDARSAIGERETRVPGADDLAVLQYTSGSVADPKGVCLDHGNLLHNLDAISTNFDLRSSDSGSIWLPPFHDMGLIGGLLAPLFADFPVSLMMPIQFLRSPVDWLQSISTQHATVAGAPNFAFDYCVDRIADEALGDLDLRSWRVAFSGAEPIRPQTIDRFIERFSPFGFSPEAFHPCYGLAESTLLVAGKTSGSLPRMVSFDPRRLEHGRAVEAQDDDELPARTIVSCGIAANGLDLSIVEPTTGDVCAERTIGEIWVRGSSVARGYWHRPGDPAFAAVRSDGAAGFLRTGDLGFSLEGELFVVGRRKDVLIVRGGNHYPQDLEATISATSTSFVPHGCVVFSLGGDDGPELIVAVQELIRGAPEVDVEAIAGEIRREVAAIHEIALGTVVLAPAGSIPRTTSNKVQRSRCRDLFLRDELAIRGVSVQEPRLPDTPIERVDLAQLRALPPRAAVDLIANTILQLASGDAKPGSGNMSLVELGLDSLMALELTHRIETTLGLVLRPSMVLGSMSVTELAQALVAQFNGLDDAAPHVASPTCGERMRQSYWLHGQLAPESAAYVGGVGLLIEGHLDHERLDRALADLAERHPTLQSRYRPTADGIAAWTPDDRSGLSLVVWDARDWSDTAVADRMQGALARPFDLEAAPLARAELFARSEANHVLALSVHQAAADFWSAEALFGELLGRYEDGAYDPPAPFVGSLDHHLVDLEVATQFWQRSLAPPIPVLELPHRGDRPVPQSYAADSIASRLDPTLLAAVDRRAQELGVTRFTVLLAGYALFLQRFGNPEVIVGTPTTGRLAADAARDTSSLTSPLALRIETNRGMSLGTLVHHVREVTLSAMDHQAVSFPDIVAAVNPLRDLARSPVFQAMFVLQQPHGQLGRLLAAAAMGLGGERAVGSTLTIRSLPSRRTGTPFDLTVMMAELETGLGASLVYNADLFDADTAAMFASAFERTLSAVARCEADTPLAHLPVVDPEEARSAAQLFLRPSTSGGNDLVQDQIRRVAHVRPDGVAVWTPDAAVTFRELETRALTLERRLRASTTEGGPVLLALEPGIDAVSAMLAALRSGLAFLPIDVRWPAARIDRLRRLAGADLVITDAPNAAALPAGVVHLRMDQIHESSADESAGSPPQQATQGERNIACLYATSGSTGNPKLVAIDHHAIASQVASISEVLGYTTNDRVLVVEPPSFVSAIRQMLAPLAAGASIAFMPTQEIGDARRVCEIIGESKSTVVSASPTLLNEWTAGTSASDRSAHHLAALAQLRLVGSASESLSGRLASRLSDWAPNADIINLFGHTEASGIATHHRVTNDDPSGGGFIPAGRPCPSSEVYLLDEELELVGVGMRGEIHLGGALLSSGYWDDARSTAERFLPNPFGGPGSRMYATGDLGRLWASRLEFLGRADEQFKLHGHRIEPGEVQAVLESNPLVSSSRVLIRQDGGVDRLVAYIRGVPDASVSIAELRSLVNEQLPASMRPSVLRTVDEWPRTPNGKLDVESLPSATVVRSLDDATFTAPTSDLERQLAGLWSEILPVDRVGIHDNFFDLGGTSVDALKLHRQLVARLDRADLQVVDLFRHTSIASLAGFLSDRDRGPSLHMKRAGTSAAKRRTALLRRRRGKAG
jgi:amino acid adenylation domain-containing protein